MAATTGVSAFAFQGTNAHVLVSSLAATSTGFRAQAVTSAAGPPLLQWSRQRFFPAPPASHLICLAQVPAAPAIRLSSPQGGFPSPEVTMECFVGHPALSFLMQHRVRGAALAPASFLLAVAAAAVAAASASQTNGAAAAVESYALQGAAFASPCDLTQALLSSRGSLRVTLQPGSGQLVVSASSALASGAHGSPLDEAFHACLYAREAAVMGPGVESPTMAGASPALLTTVPLSRGGPSRSTLVALLLTTITEQSSYPDKASGTYPASGIFSGIDSGVASLLPLGDGPAADSGSGGCHPCLMEASLQAVALAPLLGACSSSGGDGSGGVARNGSIIRAVSRIGCFLLPQQQQRSYGPGWEGALHEGGNSFCVAASSSSAGSLCLVSSSGGGGACLSQIQYRDMGGWDMTTDEGSGVAPRSWTRADAGQAGHAHALQAAAPLMSAEEVRLLVDSLVAAALGGSDPPGGEEPLMGAGLDSLGAVELRNGLQVRGKWVDGLVPGRSLHAEHTGVVQTPFSINLCIKISLAAPWVPVAGENELRSPIFDRPQPLLFFAVRRAPRAPCDTGLRLPHHILPVGLPPCPAAGCRWRWIRIGSRSTWHARPADQGGGL